MDNTSAGAVYVLNEAVWTVNLSGLAAATLNFSHISFADENDLLPSTSYTGHANGDGVSISADGNTWYPLWNADSPSTWTNYAFDLAAAARTAGITLGANFRIKFQQYDNFDIATDGRGFD